MAVAKAHIVTKEALMTSWTPKSSKLMPRSRELQGKRGDGVEGERATDEWLAVIQFVNEKEPIRLILIRVN
ncbi:hypothetical protein Droror1_Dr00011236 [Drosera rotundifolia]